MGHKKPARANRVGVWVKHGNTPERMVVEHESKWFSKFNGYADSLREDWVIRQAVKKIYGEKAGISRVQVSRKANIIVVEIYSIRPANILGRDNSKLDNLKAEIAKNGIESAIDVNVMEASYTDPRIIAERIAFDLEKRIAFRRACKTAISKAMSNHDVTGIKVYVSGRLGGAEIARTEWYLEGKVPLHTLRANIDNGFAEADTTYGKIGVKVIIHRSSNALGRPPREGNNRGEMRREYNNNNDRRRESQPA